jgi:hypothetical protein
VCFAAEQGAAAVALPLPQMEQAATAETEAGVPAAGPAEVCSTSLRVPVALVATAALVMLLWFLGNWRYYGRALGNLLQQYL